MKSPVHIGGVSCAARPAALARAFSFAIRAVVANGRYFDRAALDSLLVKAQRQP
jgi:hypothetical protein